MKINLITIGNKQPGWINQGYLEYAKRLPAELHLNLIEIPAEKRGKNAAIERITEKEGEKMLAAIPDNNLVIAMEIDGQAWPTEQLAEQISDWQMDGSEVSLLVGGPEGLAPACKARAKINWSLSPLTLPHPLVRVIIAEQIYRAWSILKNHPYHR